MLCLLLLSLSLLVVLVLVLVLVLVVVVVVVVCLLLLVVEVLLLVVVELLLLVVVVVVVVVVLTNVVYRIVSVNMCNIHIILKFPRRDSKPKKRLPRTQGDTMCIIVLDVYDRPVFSESLLGFGVSSGEIVDII